MRNLNQVLNAIVNQIPKDVEYRENIIKEFDSVCESISYTAPEALHLRWYQCADILFDYIPEPTLDWQKTITRIFSAEVDYKEYL